VASDAGRATTMNCAQHPRRRTERQAHETARRTSPHYRPARAPCLPRAWWHSCFRHSGCYAHSCSRRLRCHSLRSPLTHSGRSNSPMTPSPRGIQSRQPTRAPASARPPRPTAQRRCWRLWCRESGREREVTPPQSLWHLHLRSKQPGRWRLKRGEGARRGADLLSAEAPSPARLVAAQRVGLLVGPTQPTWSVACMQRGVGRRAACGAGGGRSDATGRLAYFGWQA